MASQHQNCRMYENQYPEVDDVVMVEVKSIAEMGAYVHLLEYNNIEGMILLSELSRRRIRSITKLIKVGRQEPVMVLRVDKSKGYIDLSKRRVSPEDLSACEERYQKSKLVHSIMRHVAETQSVDLFALYSVVAWPLYKLNGHAHDAFKVMVVSPDEMWDKLKAINEKKVEVIEEGKEEVVKEEGKGWEIVTPAVKEAVMKNVRRRMTPQPLKIRADLEMTCFTYGGVEHIKDAMRKAEALSSEDIEIKMKLVAPPLYVLTTQTLDKNRGLELLREACEKCKTTIEGHKGKLQVKSEARVVSAQDDKLLNDQLEQLAAANAEVDGDADSEEDEEGMGDVDISGPGITA